MKENMRKVKQTGKVIAQEAYVLDIDGKEIWYQSTIVPVFDDNNKLDYLLIISADITERKQAEEELQSSENRFRSMFEDHSAMMLLIEPESGKILDSNNSASRFYGYSRKELSTMNINNINTLSPEEVEEKRKQAAEKYLNIFEFQHRLKNNDIRDVEVHSTPIEYMNQKILFSIIYDITERKIVEVALFKSEKKYRELVDLAQEGIWAIDKQNITTFVNPSMARMLGYSSEEMLGKSLFYFMDEAGIKIANENLKRRQAGIREQHDFEFMSKNGDRIIAALETTPILDSAGNYEGAIAGIINITERKLAEQELIESEQKYRNIAENLPGIVLRYKLNTDGTDELLYVSKGVEDLYEVSQEDAINNNKLLWERVHKDDLDAYISSVKQSAKNLTFWKIENRIQLPDGRIKWAYMSGLPVKQEDGSIIWDSVGLDITDQKKAEEKLQELNQFRNSVIENANVWLNVLDKDSKVVIWNNAAEKISGYSRDEVIGKSEIWEWFYPEKAYRDEITAKAAEIIERDKVLEDFETNLCCKDGSYRTISWNSRNLTDGNGNSMGSIALGRDVTLRKQAEEELMKQKTLSEEYINSLPGLFYVFDEQKFVRWNKEWNRVTGFSDEEIASKYGPDFFEGEDKEHIIEGMQEVFEKGESSVEAYISAAEGKRIPFLFTGLRKNWSGINYLIGMGTDISNRKRAEETLQTRMSELEIFNEAAVDRELEINRLRKEINELLEKLGRELKYEIVE